MNVGRLDQWIVVGLGILVSILGGLCTRLLRRLDDLFLAKEKHACELRDTRSAIARIEGKLNLDPYPYGRE